VLKLLVEFNITMKFNPIMTLITLISYFEKDENYTIGRIIVKWNYKKYNGTNNKRKNHYTVGRIIFKKMKIIL